MEWVQVIFLRFCAVGALGFLVDSGVTLLMVQLLESGPVVVAFLLAATVTWYVNRSYAFRSSAPNASLLPYLTFTAFGALINFAVYLYWIRLFGAAPTQIVIGIACASVVALSFNFLVLRHVVFRAR
jgi:putative flippase GtrA